MLIISIIWIPLVPNFVYESIGDRFYVHRKNTPLAWLGERLCVVEGIRSGFQTSCCTCDWLMDWISWRAWHERRGWRSRSASAADVFFLTASARRPGSKPDQAMAMSTMDSCKSCGHERILPTVIAVGPQGVKFCAATSIGKSWWKESCGASSRRVIRPWCCFEAETHGLHEIREFGDDFTTSFCVASEILKISSFQPFKLGVFFFQLIFLHFLQMIQERIGPNLLVYTTSRALPVLLSEVVPCSLQEVHDFQHRWISIGYESHENKIIIARWNLSPHIFLFVLYIFGRPILHSLHPTSLIWVEYYWDVLGLILSNWILSPI